MVLSKQSLSFNGARGSTGLSVRLLAVDMCNEGSFAYFQLVLTEELDN